MTRRQLDSSAWRRILRDVYVSSRTPDTHLLRCKAAALILPPEAALTGRSAALVWGAKLRDYDGPVEIAARKRFGPVRGLKIVTAQLDGDDVVTRWGMPVTSALWTAWHIARSLPLMDAVAWVDSLGRARAMSRVPLREEAARHTGEMGSRAAAKVLNLCDPRSESPPESHLRVAIVRAGLPAPIPQYQVLDGGEFVARVDLAWPKVKFAVEYDGQWHVDRAQLADDRSRLRLLNAVDWYVYHVTNRDMRDMDALLRDLGSALARRVAERRRPGRSAAAALTTP